MTRLGKSAQDQTCLILITVNDEETKKQILHNAAKLRHVSTWKDVFISPDLTFNERQALLESS